MLNWSAGLEAAQHLPVYGLATHYSFLTSNNVWTDQKHVFWLSSRVWLPLPSNAIKMLCQINSQGLKRTNSLLHMMVDNRSRLQLTAWPSAHAQGPESHSLPWFAIEPSEFILCVWWMSFPFEKLAYGINLHWAFWIHKILSFLILLCCQLVYIMRFLNPGFSIDKLLVLTIVIWGVCVCFERCFCFLAWIW